MNAEVARIVIDGFEHPGRPDAIKNLSILPGAVAGAARLPQRQQSSLPCENSSVF
jgi:hypothetical protein